MFVLLATWLSSEILGAPINCTWPPHSTSGYTRQHFSGRTFRPSDVRCQPRPTPSPHTHAGLVEPRSFRSRYGHRPALNLIPPTVELAKAYYYYYQRSKSVPNLSVRCESNGRTSRTESSQESRFPTGRGVLFALLAWCRPWRLTFNPRCSSRERPRRRKTEQEMEAVPKEEEEKHTKTP